jgi:hypothetical protein
LPKVHWISLASAFELSMMNSPRRCRIKPARDQVVD